MFFKLFDKPKKFDRGPVVEKIQPVKNIVLGDLLGPRLLQGKPDNHIGVDMTSGTDDRRVFAPCAGRIVFDYDTYNHILRWSNSMHSAGNMVILDTGNYYIRFLHLVENYVSHGQQINPGDVLGVYGDCGFSFGAHLHVDICFKTWAPCLDPSIVYPLININPGA